ncbi:MAG: phosphomevalonate kinase [Clostridiales bacterium]|nr:phosphomevalonate kinase [Clostridiales bacterium]
MSQRTFCIRVPGKLMIAGEYAVLEPNHKGIVVAVDRYITAHISFSDKNQLSLPQLGLENITWQIKDGKVAFDAKDSQLNFIQNAISVASLYLQEKSLNLRKFQLKIESQLNNAESGIKYGLGSSAAIVVAVISAILSIHCTDKKDLDPDKIFKLSAIVHLKTQGNGSGADIAAAVYGGWLQYSTFNTQWIINQIETGVKVSELVKKQWPNLYIASLIPPSGLRLAVGWTKEAASTKAMIDSIYDFRRKNPQAYEEFLRESAKSVEGIIESFRTDNIDEAIKYLRLNRKALNNLGERAGLEIETEKLKMLCSIADVYGSGKPSGAGGGDCGIAFLQDTAKIQDLYNDWQQENIVPLDLKVSRQGLSIFNI